MKEGEVIILIIIGIVVLAFLNSGTNLSEQTKTSPSKYWSLIQPHPQ